MFKDYYAILEITFPSNTLEIKSSYRELTIKWHPDRNEKDTMDVMIDINEAYNVLSDASLKDKYDKEYVLFKQTQTKPYDYSVKKDYAYYNYDMQDDSLKRDIYNARSNAEQFVRELIESLKKTTKTAAKGAFDSVLPYLIAGAILFLIGQLYLCSNAN